MKLIYLSLIIALAAALSLTGCGKDESQNTNGNIVATNPAVPVPGVNVPAGTIPVGCYNNGSNTCAPCPYGMVSNGSYCSQSPTGGNSYGCPQGTFYNGYQCQQIGYTTGCPAGTTWNWTFYACTFPYQQYPTYNYSNCTKKTYGSGLLWVYVCY